MRHRSASAREILLGALVLVVAAVVAAAGWAGSSAAQDGTPAAGADAPTPIPFRETVVAHAVVEGLPADQALLSVETVTLPPGQTASTMPYPGPVVIRVREGSVVLDAENAVVGAVIAPIGPLHPATPVPGPAVGRRVGPDEQIVLPADVAARLGNPGDRPVALFVISVSAEGAPGGSTPMEGEPAAGVGHATKRS